MFSCESRHGEASMELPVESEVMRPEIACFAGT